MTRFTIIILLRYYSSFLAKLTRSHLHSLSKAQGVQEMQKFILVILKKRPSDSNMMGKKTSVLIKMGHSLN